MCACVCACMPAYVCFHTCARSALVRQQSSVLETVQGPNHRRRFMDGEQTWPCSPSSPDVISALKTSQASLLGIITSSILPRTLEYIVVKRTAFGLDFSTAGGERRRSGSDYTMCASSRVRCQERLISRPGFPS